MPVLSRLIHLDRKRSAVLQGADQNNLLPLLRRRRKRDSHLIQGPCGVAGDGKVGVEGDVHDILLGFAGAGLGLDLGEALADEQDAIDEEAVGVALDLKVAEEGVCAEQGEDLVEDVVALVVRVGRLVGGQRDEREGVGGTAGLGAQGEEREVANEARSVRVVVEDGVVGLKAVVGVVSSGRCPMTLPGRAGRGLAGLRHSRASNSPSSG